MSEERHYTLRCERIVADEPNHNGNIYPEAVMKQMVEDAQGRIQDRRFLGRLGSSIDRVRIMDASHLVTGLRYVEPGNLEADIEVLNTDQGNELLRLLQIIGADGYEVIPFGVGSVTARDERTRVVGSDYKMSALDVVPKLRGTDEVDGRSDPHGAEDSQGEGRLHSVSEGGAGSEATLSQGKVWVVFKWYGDYSDGEASCLKVYNSHEKARAFCEGYDNWNPEFCAPDDDSWGTEYYMLQIEELDIE